MWTTFAATSRDRSFRSFLTLKILLHLAVVLLRAFTLSHDVDVGVWVPSTVMCQSQDKIYLRRNSYYHKKSLNFLWKHLKISFKTARNISLKPLNPAFNRNMLHSRLTQSSSNVVMGRVGHELCSYDSGPCRCRQSGWGQSVVHGRVGCHFPRFHMVDQDLKQSQEEIINCLAGHIPLQLPSICAESAPITLSIHPGDCVR